MKDKTPPSQVPDLRDVPLTEVSGKAAETAVSRVLPEQDAVPVSAFQSSI